MQGGGPVMPPSHRSRFVHSGTELQLYSVNTITSGTDAQGEVTVRTVQLGGRIVNGQGAEPDIVVALQGFPEPEQACMQARNAAHPQV